jgi:hypothetical protein
MNNHPISELIDQLFTARLKAANAIAVLVATEDKTIDEKQDLQDLILAKANIVKALRSLGAA